MSLSPWLFVRYEPALLTNRFAVNLRKQHGTWRGALLVPLTGQTAPYTVSYWFCLVSDGGFNWVTDLEFSPHDKGLSNETTCSDTNECNEKLRANEHHILCLFTSCYMGTGAIFLLPLNLENPGILWFLKTILKKLCRTCKKGRATTFCFLSKSWNNAAPCFNFLK